MHIICSDLEGVFVPEIWINVAERTGIDDLRLTTRDISDYDVLMKRRLSILDANGLKLKDITDVIAGMDPLPGARAFLDWLRARTQVVVVSDTFVEFARPLMEKLGWPTLLCHNLTVDANGAIVGYNLRQADGKRQVVQAFRRLNYQVLAMGDSYNDVAMLKEADQGILFRPPQNVIEEYPDYPVATTYGELKVIFGKELDGKQ
ncbi:MAG TPA: bifunctional phosphoserine phosphatase/homoserine phosphotransferase ThrH [Desulfosarcina sp.]|nr:bifunctional phosphoserine phosphatase/homoserine phosphotransferase ThrH [Desulfosarcina sp.]